MSRKSKLTDEERKRAVQECIEGKSSINGTAKKYGIGFTTLQQLVMSAKNEGMSRVGRCIDNGPMEGWWGILKSEMYYLRKFTSREELITAIENYITYYHTKRYQLRLNCMTPMEYHEAYAA